MRSSLKRGLIPKPRQGKEKRPTETASTVATRHLELAIPRADTCRESRVSPWWLAGTPQPHFCNSLDRRIKAKLSILFPSFLCFINSVILLCTKEEAHKTRPLKTYLWGWRDSPAGKRACHTSQRTRVWSLEPTEG